MEPETPLIDVKELKTQMAKPVQDNLQLLQKILQKGIDTELLSKLEMVGVDPQKLENLKKEPIETRAEALELMVIQLLVRTKRLERENELRYLEHISTLVKMGKLTQLTPMVEHLHKHFFEEPESLGNE